jgi:hypothetical protein
LIDDETANGMLQTALKPELSELRDDLKPFTRVILSPEDLTISDHSLLSSPVPSVSSSEDVNFEE